MNVLVVVQARVGSSRLPGKVLLPVGGETLLVAMLRRVKRAHTPFDLVVATTTDPADQTIVDLCDKIGQLCFRGHPTDLLSRHYHVALERNASVVVKIPSDCPLIDPLVIDRVLQYYLEVEGRFDFVSNLHPATYPDGNDVEVVSMECLETAHREAKRPMEREHTTPFIWEHPDRFRLGNVAWESGLDLSMSHRFTLDYEADYRFIARVFEELGGPEAVFSLNQILELLQRKPEIAKLNSHLAGVNWYRHHLSELTQVGKSQTRTQESHEH